MISIKDGLKIYEKIQKIIPYKTYIVGSIKRKVSLIKDIDILVVINNLKEYEIFLSIIKSIIFLTKTGEKIISGIYENNKIKIQIDFFMTSKVSLPFAMLQYTGPKSYNIRIRKYVHDTFNWKLNQYGIYYVNTDKKVKGTSTLKTEKDILNFINVNYYKPEDRK